MCAGDTLFVGGCGKFFEGTAQEMYHALCEVLSSLPPDTVSEVTHTTLHPVSNHIPLQHVFCGHEYTVNNLKYAQHVEPENKTITDKMEWSKVSVFRRKLSLSLVFREKYTDLNCDNVIR